ncbi:MAG: leucine-rich repeat protein [Clostridia bacterium]|nr:leucine-rich repeat protein [Clostridia bacterium]
MVEFPASLSELGSLAFYGCTSLAVLDGLENTAIKSIGAQAFEGCTALQEISLPKNLETIGSDAFKSCTSLYDITIPKSVSSIGSFALSFTPWYQEKKDKFLIVGDGVLIKCTVNPYTCEVPGTLDLSDLNIKHIGNSCFIDAYSAEIATSNGYRFTFYLKNVILPEGLISIGDKAFYGCLNLESAKLPSTLTSIGNQAFFVYSGGEYSYLNINFDNCTNLKAIGSYAFYGCYNTEKVELPASVTYVGDSAFIETKAFYDFIDSSAKKNDGNHFYVTGDGVLLFAYVAKDVTDLIIPDGVKMISGGACTGWDSQYVFDDYENDPTVSEAIKSKHRLTYAIRKLVLPEGVNVIGENAFFRVGGIDNLVVPNTVTRIENSAFMLCKSLRVLKLSNKVEYIGNSCFAYSNLQAIELPDTLTYIGYSPFIECSLLKTIIIPASVKTFGSPVIDETMVGLESIYLQKENRKLLTSVVQLYSAKTIIYYYD